MRAIQNIAFIFMGALFTCVGTYVSIQLLFEEPAMIWLGLIFVIVGLAILALGIFGMVHYVARKKETNALIDQGLWVPAEIVDIVDDYSVRVNGRPGYRVICQYTDENGDCYEFESEMKMSGARKYPFGRKLRVYVDDPTSITDYIVDLKGGIIK